jgi:hypothetical protein
MNPKILVAILIGLGLLFFVGVGLGATVNGEHPGTPGTLGLPGADLFTRLVQKPVRAGEITADCRNDGRLNIQANGQCSGTVRYVDETARVLWLHLTANAGTTADLKLDQPGSVTAKATVVPGDTAKLDIFKDDQKRDSTLTVRCNGGPCVLNIASPTPTPRP